jgi:hypothetical protein
MITLLFVVLASFNCLAAKFTILDIFWGTIIFGLLDYITFSFGRSMGERKN